MIIKQNSVSGACKAINDNSAHSNNTLLTVSNCNHAFQSFPNIRPLSITAHCKQHVDQTHCPSNYIQPARSYISVVTGLVCNIYVYTFTLNGKYMHIHVKPHFAQLRYCEKNGIILHVSEKKLVFLSILISCDKSLFFLNRNEKFRIVRKA